MKKGIAISTYFCEKTYKNRLSVFKQSIDSLIKTDFDGNIFIIDDGSTINDHLQYIKDNYNKIIIVKKENNGGIARTKNTSIRVLLENNCDIGFVADDDIHYKNGWDLKYQIAITTTKIPHFCFFWHREEAFCDEREYNEFKILFTNVVSGCFFTITKKLINAVGYFKIFPYKYGHEHTNFTARCRSHKQIPFFCDIIDAQNYLCLINPQDIHSSLGEIDQEQMNKNESLIWVGLHKKESCIE